MSLGFSISDIVLLVKLASTTVRRACGEYNELTRETLSLHAVLRRLDQECQKSESPINREGDTCREELEPIVGGCRKVLRVLNIILEKYNALSDDKRSVRKLWKTVRFGNGELTNLSDLRSKVTYYTSMLSLLLNMASVGSVGRVEKQMDVAGGELKRIRIAVNSIAAQLVADGGREGSVLTAYENDDRAVWKELRRELVRDGFSSSVIRKHHGTIIAYVKELAARGLLDEQELTEEVEANESSTRDNPEDTAIRIANSSSDSAFEPSGAADPCIASTVLDISEDMPHSNNAERIGSNISGHRVQFPESLNHEAIIESHSERTDTDASRIAIPSVKNTDSPIETAVFQLPLPNEFEYRGTHDEWVSGPEGKRCYISRGLNFSLVLHHFQILCNQTVRCLPPSAEALEQAIGATRRIKHDLENFFTITIHLYLLLWDLSRCYFDGDEAQIFDSKAFSIFRKCFFSINKLQQSVAAHDPNSRLALRRCLKPYSQIRFDFYAFMIYWYMQLLDNKYLNILTFLSSQFNNSSGHTMPRSEWERMNIEPVLDVADSYRGIELHAFGHIVVLGYNPRCRKIWNLQLGNSKAWQVRYQDLRYSSEKTLRVLKVLSEDEDAARTENFLMLHTKIQEAAESMLAALSHSRDLPGWPRLCYVHERHISELGEMLRAVSSRKQAQSESESQAGVKSD